MTFLKTLMGFGRNQPAPELKSSSSLASGFFGLYEQLLTGSNVDLAASVAISYTKKVAPVWHAIEYLADECSTIRPIIFDKENNKSIEDHPLLDLMTRPNATTSGELFLKELFEFYLITGNAYYAATGGVNRPPLELITVHPTRVSTKQNQWDGYLQSYNVTTIGIGEEFDRNEIDGRFRYVSRDDRELCHIRTFNPDAGTGAVFHGMSKLTPVYYEIEQYLLSSVHNKSVLEKGATLSGIFSTEGNLTDDQFNRLQAQINQWFSGARNAGRPMLAEGGTKFESMMANNRDMDFLNLKKDCRNMVYSIFKIPLPIVTPDRMTFSNIADSTLMLYDNAVIPLFNTVMGTLGDQLLPRYNLDPKRFYLSYVEDDIPALKQRSVDRVLKMSTAGIKTVNELRADLGLGEIEGGNVLYQPGTLVPLGTDTDTRNQKPTDRSKLKSSGFMQMLEAKTDDKGEPLYTEEELIQIASEFGLIS